MPKTSLDLTGIWEFKQYPLSARRMRDLDSADWLKTPVPSSIFNSLISAGKIKQIDIDTNPEDFSSVSEKPWVYRKIFDAPADLLESDCIDLVFDGLDTITNIWLNDKLIGKTNNMFIPFRFDVTGFLKPKNNILMVKFEPAADYAKKLMERYTSFSEADFRNPYRTYIRKAQYQFGWDFCPSLPGCGIFRPVKLEGIKKARFADLHTKTVDCNHHYADIKIDVELDFIQKEQFLCQLTLSCDGQTIHQNLNFDPGENFHSTVIRIENPSLWWPAGYGPQNLHLLDAKLLNNNEVIDQTQKKFGIRTVKLNRSTGKKRKFQFEINDKPIFAKGANWIPPSIFAGSTTADDYEELLHNAQKANINMLRIWGGGYYESDHFYQLCDQLGIMVWQDFMFACAYYPDRQWFLKEVKKEATEIIKSLRNHPCMALWCGNNEIDWMHNTGKLGKGKKFHGKEIYHRLLPQLVSELNPDVSYIPTTPRNEKSKTDQPLTTHQWQVWSGNQPVQNYLCPIKDIPTFVTEFGLQSLPSTKTIENFCPHQQLRIGSQILEKHNYQLDGNSRLFRYIGDLFGTTENLKHFAYLSQITQARAVKTYVEHLRAHNSINSGVLFWQFNDCCPAISWSAIDYNKQPKALYYYAKRFFAKQIVTVIPELKARADSPPELKSLNVIAINDSDQPLNATINCRLIDLSGRKLDQIVFPTAIGPFSTSPSLKLPKALTSPENPEKSCLHLVMEKNGEKITENLFLYLPDKYIDWPKVEITKKLKQINEKQWKLKLKANAIAKDVQILTTVPTQLSQNFIDLIPHDEFEITIDCHQKVTSLNLALLQLPLLRS